MAISRIVTSSLGTAVWRAGLADPHLHWRRTRSAWEMAVSWEASARAASGIPEEIRDALNAHPEFRNPQLLVGVVEHRVELDTAKTPSQNDLWCMVSTDTGQASVAVEAKAGEDFDKTLHEWLGGDSASAAKRNRLSFLREVLGGIAQPDLRLRYQLFHRAASAVLEAKRWRISKALMLIQSFNESPSSWQDYEAFCASLGVVVQRNRVGGPANINGIQLYFAWVDSPVASDAIAAQAV